MNILSWIVLGSIIGVLIDHLDHDPKTGGIIGAVMMGKSGAMLGGLSSSLIFGSGVMSFNIDSFILSVLGALMMVFIFRLGTTSSKKS